MATSLRRGRGLVVFLTKVSHDMSHYSRSFPPPLIIASTTTGSATLAPTGVLDEIQALFDWNLPDLIPGKRKSSTATRRPPFFDKHFDDKYILKRVQRLPSLVDDLAKNVDTALSAASNTLPPLEGFFTAEQRELKMYCIECTAEDEKAVANFYGATTAEYCLPVASTLAIHPNAPFWLRLVTWMQSISSSGYAIMDGQLSITRVFCAKSRSHMDSIINSIVWDHDIFEEMRKLNLPFATWGMMSLSTGSPEVMSMIPNLGDFKWVKCLNCDMTKKNIRQQATMSKSWTLDLMRGLARGGYLYVHILHERILLIIF